MHAILRFALLCLAAGGLVAADITLNTDSVTSIEQVSSEIIENMLSYYSGNEPGQIPGVLPMPYYWWETGGMFGHLVDHYYYTGDSKYNKEIISAITWQAGSDGAFMPPNQTRDEGNDDQVFWAFAAMDAAELKFPPGPSSYPSWAAMAQGVFNLQSERWDPSTCGGGLRWQITSLNNGYTYKNMPSNGGFFQLSARLARYTNNNTYVGWAEKAWDWISTSVLYDTSEGAAYRIYDGTEDTNNCAVPNKAQYTYNYGTLISALAYMYNHTEDAKWLDPLNGVLAGLTSTFVKNGVLVEMGCEPFSDCNTDGLTFKGFTLRWMAVAAQLVPEVAPKIWPIIKASAMGAAGQCEEGATGAVCGYHWTTTTYDGTAGVGQQMSALGAIQANMIPLKNLFAPLTLATGAISKGDPNAGMDENEDGLSRITTADRAGAGIMTVIIMALISSGTYWLIAIESE